MPLITSKQVWTRQPQTRQQLNPLFSDRLIALVVPGQPEYFGGGLPVISGVGKIVPARAGIAAKAVYNGAGANEVRWPVNLSFSGNYTFSVFSSNEDQIADLQTFYTSGIFTNNIAHGNVISSAIIDNNGSPTITTTASYTPRLISARRRSNQCSVVVDKTASSENVTGTRDQVWTALNVGRDGASNSVGTTNYLIAVWNRYVSDEVLFALSENPWQVFKKKDRRIWIPSAGGGGLSLTGSLTGQGSTLSASATNTEVHALYGVLVGAGSTLSGTATRIYSLTGSLTGQGATLSGSATTLESHAATGALVGAGSTLSATATNTEIHAATGSLIGAGSTLSGSATHTPVGINASGSLVGQGATLSATATNTEVHICTGALYGQGATLSGALTRVFSASGSLVGAGSTLSATAGNAVAVFSATGSLVGQGSTLTGSATNTETHAVSGSLAGQGATLSATAALANLHTLSGSLVGGGAILVGYASGPTTALDAPPDAIVTVINKRNRVSVISRRS